METAKLKAPLKLINGRLRLNLSLHRYFTYPGDYDDRAVGMKRTVLADSGFFMVYDKRSLQCFFCLLQITSLRNWTNLTIDQFNERHATKCLKYRGSKCPLMTQLSEDTSAAENVPIIESSSRYDMEAYRLLSLLKHAEKWPITSTDMVQRVSVYDLAKSGFYYSGEDDNCLCHFCKLAVRGWEPGDTATKEHIRWNPTCVREASDTNVRLGSDREYALLLKDKSDIKKTGIRLLSYTSSIDLGVIHVDAPVAYSQYKTIETRLKSFVSWPAQMTQKPTQLATNGFFYTGTGDRVICFYCGGGLKDWAIEDIPEKEHAKWFARCPYPKFKPYRGGSNRARSVNASGCEKLSSMICIVCKTLPVNCVSLPCSHIDVCNNCILETSNCTECGNKRHGFVRIYM